LGEWDIEVKIEAKNRDIIRKIELEIRQKFADLIQEYQTMPLYDTMKISHFPEFILK